MFCRMSGRSSRPGVAGACNANPQLGATHGLECRPVLPVEASRPATAHLRFDFSTIRLRAGKIPPDLRLNMVEDLPMNERITKPENHARTPVVRVPSQPYTEAQDAQGRPMTGRETERLTRRGEPLTRTERLLVTMFVTMFATMIAAGALGFTTLSGQLLDMQEQIGGLRVEMHEEIDGLRVEMHEEIDGLRTEIREEIGELSERMDQLSDRMTRVETLIETHLVPASDARNPAEP